MKKACDELLNNNNKRQFTQKEAEERIKNEETERKNQKSNKKSGLTKRQHVT